MDTVLVTGVAGFMGSNLVPRLLEKGYRVIGVDNLSHGHLGNMAKFADHVGFEFRPADIRDGDTIAELVDRSVSVVHLAAYKIPRYSDALDTLHVNAFGSDVVFSHAASVNSSPSKSSVAAV